MSREYELTAALDRVRALCPQTFEDGVEFFYAEDVRDAIDGGAS